MVHAQEGLSYDEALEVLGYKPGAIVSPHFAVFREVERKLGELALGARDAERRARACRELERLSAALRVVEAESYREPSLRARGAWPRFVLSLILVAGVVGAMWHGNRLMLSEEQTRDVRKLETLAVDGRIAVESRDWVRAEKIYADLALLEAGSVRAQDGLRLVAEGKEEARRQKLGFLVGSARAAMEEREWDEAENRLKQVLTMEEGHPDVAGLLEEIRKGRVYDQVAILLESAQESLRDEEWASLADYTSKLEALDPEHAQLAVFKAAAVEGMKIIEERRVRARGLYEEALAMDNGEFSEVALESLREAIRLDNREEYQQLYNKMSGYARLLRVPDDYSTIGEALAAARPNDKVRVGEGIYTEALILNARVDLEGAGRDETVIQCEAEDASVLLVTREARGSRVAGLTLKQTGLALTPERYPVAVADGSDLNLEDCHIEHGSGHGVAVINGGRARLRNVRVVKCGWDGLAVNGEDSSAEADDCRFESNFHHGIDAWGGGRVAIRKSRSTRNGLAGIVLMSRGVPSEISQCTIDGNREVGVSVSNGVRAVLRANRVQGNLLGGVLVEGDGTVAAMEGNVAEKNNAFGIVVDRASKADPFRDNISRGNTGEQVQLQAVMPQEAIAPPLFLDLPASKPVEAGPAAQSE